MVVHTRRGTFTALGRGRVEARADAVSALAPASARTRRVTSRLLGSAGVVVLGMLREENIKD